MYPSIEDFSSPLKLIVYFDREKHLDEFKAAIIEWKKDGSADVLLLAASYHSSGPHHR